MSTAKQEACSTNPHPPLILLPCNPLIDNGMLAGVSASAGSGLDRGQPHNIESLSSSMRRDGEHNAVGLGLAACTATVQTRRAV